MNRKRNYVIMIALLAGSIFMASPVVARASQQDSQPAADNTKTNQRDMANGSPTADQQTMSASDVAITKKIRMAIHKDSALSIYAHNVKIITQGGKVTLKGPVRSEDEKSKIGTRAAAIAGDGNVDNQLDVTPSK